MKDISDLNWVLTREPKSTLVNLGYITRVLKLNKSKKWDSFCVGMWYNPKLGKLYLHRYLAVGEVWYRVDTKQPYIPLGE